MTGRAASPHFLCSSPKDGGAAAPRHLLRRLQGRQENYRGRSNFGVDNPAQGNASWPAPAIQSRGETMTGFIAQLIVERGFPPPPPPPFQGCSS